MALSIIDILSTFATENDYKFVYGDRGVQNLIGSLNILEPDQVGIFLLPVVDEPVINQYGSASKTKTTGTILLCQHNAIDSGSQAEGGVDYYLEKYNEVIKDLKELASGQILSYISCNNFSIQYFRIREVINLFAHNLDGVYIEFGIEIENDATGYQCPEVDAEYELTIEGETVGSGSIPQGGPTEIPIDDFISGECEDASYTLKSNDLTVIRSGTIPSGDNDDIIAPNAEVTYNGGTIITAIQSNQSEDLTFEYENGDPATPSDQNGTVLTFPNPQANYDPRDLINFTTLNWTNPFGNNNRFTAIDGTQIYTAGVAIDWYQFKPFAGTVICFQISPYVGTGANATTYFSTLTLGGLSVWKIWEFLEAAPLIKEIDQLNYAPFNYVITGSTATRVKINSFSFGGDVLLLLSTTAAITINRGAFTANNRQFGSRVTTLSELGL
jgi:hypothetical protein